MNIPQVITENKSRNEILHAFYNPYTGEGSPMERFAFTMIKGVTWYLPVEMKSDPVMQEILRHPTAYDYLKETMDGKDIDKKLVTLTNEINYRRMTYDFEFWVYTCIRIQDKESFKIIPFKLRKAQFKLLMSFEKQRLAGIPIRTIVGKARQWGGSTLTQMYMMWIQQKHKQNWHIAVVAHLDDVAKHIRGMYTRAAKHYPQSIGSITLAPYERSSKNLICRETNSMIAVGSVENPDQFHGYNFAMCHLSECGRWGETTKKSANELVQAIRPTVPNVPYSMIVLESTANGRGNMFHNEWVAAVSETSRYDAVFVAWFEIELYQKPIDNYKEFIAKMEAHPKREYFWGLWMKGATLEGINWYMYTQAAENFSDLQMYRQYPSDSEEMFSSTGRRVFSPFILGNAKINCLPPVAKGQLFAKGQKGKDAFLDLEYRETLNGELWIWDYPDTSINVTNRYVVVADIGGKSDGADYSTVRVIDRYYLMEGGTPEAVATWRSHLDQDLFAWVCAMIAKWYNNALLVIESNSLRKELVDTEGSQFLTVLNEISGYYDNLYTRTDPAKIREGLPAQWGFHMNIQTKPMVVNALNAAYRDETFVERDLRVIDEADCFEYHSDGTMGAVDGQHDDLLMATAIGVWVSESYMDVPRKVEPEKIKPKTKRTEASL